MGTVWTKVSCFPKNCSFLANIPQVLSFLQRMSRPEKKLSILSLQYHCYPDEVGGAWCLTYEVNKRLVARGQKVHLITCKPSESLPDYEEIDGVHFHRISFKASKGFISLWRAVRKQVSHILRAERDFLELA